MEGRHAGSLQAFIIAFYLMANVGHVVGNEL
jgi:hypothetical protein